MFATLTKLISHLKVACQLLLRRRSTKTDRPIFRATGQALEGRMLLAADFGDAPDTTVSTAVGDYSTLLSNNGPSHTVDTTQTSLFLGSRVDADSGVLQNVAADADDLQGAVNDEDGILHPNDLVTTTGAIPTVSLRATNLTGAAATLYGWIDYDADGEFDDGTERAQITVPTGTDNSQFTLTFPTVPADAAGDVYARFRLSTDAAASSSVGLAADGEVEDYAFLIQPAATLPTGPEVDRGTTIDNDVDQAVVGAFEATIGSAGNTFSSRTTVRNDATGAVLTSQDFIFDSSLYIQSGSSTIRLGSTTVTQPAVLIADDVVESRGVYAGPNGAVDWTVTSYLRDGLSTLFTTVDLASSQPLGDIRLISYLDEDVLGVSDDILTTAGTPGEGNFRVFTIDDAFRVGFSHGGIYSNDGQNQVNATYEGWAADEFSDLQNQIQGSTQAFSVPGTIDLIDLPQRSDPTFGFTWGPDDVTTAHAWIADPNATTATMTSFLQLLASDPIGEFAGTIEGVSFDDQNVNGVRDSNLLQGDNPVVQIAIDMSSNANFPLPGRPVGNVNTDFRINTALDAQLAATIELNNRLIQNGYGDTAQVALTPYGTSSLSLDMDPVTPGLQLTTTPAADQDGNGIPDVEDILRQINELTGPLGINPNYEQAVQQTVATFDALATGTDNGNLIFMTGTNGRFQLNDDAAELQTRGINTTAIAIGRESSLFQMQDIDPDAVQVTTTDELLALFNAATVTTAAGFAEPGLGGVTLYLDANQNGAFDVGERSVVSSFDDPATVDVDETGLYRFEDVLPGTYVIREVVPAGMEQTAPTFPTADSMQLFITDATGELAQLEVLTGLIEPVGNIGRPLTDLAFDTDGLMYGINDASLFQIEPETGSNRLIGAHSIPGATALVSDRLGNVYAASSQNNNLYSIDLATGASTFIGSIGVSTVADLAFLGDRLFVVSDADELWEITLQPTLTPTFIGLTGLTNVTGLAAGSNGRLYATTPTNVYEVDPASGNSILISDYTGQGVASITGTAFFGEAGGLGRNPFINLTGFRNISGIDFGNAPLANASISGNVYEDVSGNGVRELGEPGLSGLTVFLDGNDNRRADPGELQMSSSTDDFSTFAIDETGSYLFENLRPNQYVVQQVREPGLNVASPAIGLYDVTLDAAQDLRDLDFGNTLVIPDVSVTPISQTVSEDEFQPSFRVELSEPAYRDVFVPYSLSGTGILGLDYSIAQSPLVIPAGETGASIIVNVNDDAEDEPDETITVTLQQPTNGNLTAADSHTVTVIDNDEPVSLPILSIASADVVVGESNSTVSVDVRMSFASNFVIRVPFLLSGTASFMDDYTVSPAELVLQPGETSGTISLTLIDDPDSEPDETVQITLGEANNAFLGVDVTHTTTILDGDFPATVNVINALVQNRVPDPGNLSSQQPTSWAQQRSDVRGIFLQFDGKIRRASASDFVLTNLGVNADQDQDVVIPLTDQQLTLENDGQDLFIAFDQGELTEGVYSIEVSSFISGADPIVVAGNETNGLYSFLADYNGSGGVNVQDFAAFAYWFRAANAPAYIDLNQSGGVNIQDFFGYSDNFGSSIVFPGNATPPPLASSGEGELTRAANTLQRPTDTNGDGQLTPRDALGVINRIGRGLPFSFEADWVVDVNRDGDVTPLDALWVINAVSVVDNQVVVSDFLSASTVAESEGFTAELPGISADSSEGKLPVSSTQAESSQLAVDRLFESELEFDEIDLNADLSNGSLEQTINILQ